MLGVETARATYIFLYLLDCPGVDATGDSPSLHARLHVGSITAHHFIGYF